MSIAPAERVETSLEELAGLEFTPEPECRGRISCTAIATWYAMRSCGCPALPYCSPCKVDFERMSGTPACLICRTNPIAIRWESIQ